MEYNKIKEAAAYVNSKMKISPDIGLILGSGLGGIAEQIENKQVIPYGDIPNFSRSTAPGHKGQLVCGKLNGADVICMQGRLHYYEGHDMEDIILPIRMMKLLGVQTLIVTNAAGGINLSYNVGDLMLIEDHINFMGWNPLIGKNAEEFGPRFCDMSYAYTPELRNVAQKTAAKLDIDLKHGVYIGCSGPSFETPAEIRAFRTLGADAVGMSTVPEVIAASHCGLQVLAFSLITNMAAGVLDQPLSEQEVIDVGERKGKILQNLIFEIIAKIKP